MKTGDYVPSGKLLARVGVSGDSNLPHLHFEITTAPNPLAGEGLPMRDMLVDFGPPEGAQN